MPADGRTPAQAVIPKTDLTIIGELDFSGVGAVGKFKQNLAAIGLLKTIEAEGRRATTAAVAKVQRGAEQAHTEMERGFPRLDELVQKRAMQARVVAALRCCKLDVDQDTDVLAVKEGEAEYRVEARKTLKLAQIQLLESVPFENVETRLDASPEIRARGRSAFHALVQRYGATVLGDAIGQELASTGKAQLIGKAIIGPGDLAALTAMYRNATFETMRWIFVDATGVVLGESAYMSRIPAAVLNGHPMFAAKTAGTLPGISMGRAQAVQQEPTKCWGSNDPREMLVEPAEDFPASAEVDPSYVRAAGLYEGRPFVWLNVGQIKTEVRLGQVLAHEAIGHDCIVGVQKETPHHG